jgi:CDGSH iron-sulfur domain-containing protein 3
MSEQTIKMNQPVIAGTEPVCISVAPDKNYSWCTCGLSQKQPFCDSAHKQIEGMPYRSLKVKFKASEDVWFCLCKRTKTPPFCDGSFNGCEPG